MNTFVTPTHMSGHFELLATLSFTLTISKYRRWHETTNSKKKFNVNYKGLQNMPTLLASEKQCCNVCNHFVDIAAVVYCCS